jgi:hypothetical protein
LIGTRDPGVLDIWTIDYGVLKISHVYSNSKLRIEDANSKLNLSNYDLEISIENYDLGITIKNRDLELKFNDYDLEIIVKYKYEEIINYLVKQDILENRKMKMKT